MRKILIIILMLLTVNQVFPQDHNSAAPLVVTDTFYNRMFVRNSGWNGGDGAYSVLLPDGRILWTFGDSFFGDIERGRIRTGDKNVMVRNAALVQAERNSEILFSINPDEGKLAKTLVSFAGYDEQDHWYWPLDATVCGDKLHMVLMHMEKTGEGMWGFASASVDVGVFSLPELTSDTIVQNITDGKVAYGSAILEDNDGFTYLYGSSREGLDTRLHVARVKGCDLTDGWQFFNGEDWISEPSDHIVHHGVSSMFSVWKDENTYYLFTQESNLGRKLFLYKSKSPSGPFFDQKLLYTVPEKDGSGDMFSYNAIIHPELSKQGELVVSYSRNLHNFWDNFNKEGSADKYLPVFIRIYDWK